MSEFFLELFSEEIPSSSQKKLRSDLLEVFQKLFMDKSIKFKNNKSYSTPNRLVILFEELQKETIVKSEEIKGPNVNAPKEALEGFLRSNKISKEKILKKKTEKGEFYFFNTPQKKINTHDLLEELIPQILDQIQWKKSMRWGNYNLSWARPLKSILAVFDKKKINFKFHHLLSSNTTFIDKEFEEKKKIFNEFKDYNNFFKKLNIIIDQNQRKNLLEKEFKKISDNKNINVENNLSLLDEVVNLIDQPNVLICEFDKKFLQIPQEILTITLQRHQKYFPTFDQKGNITNEFLVVANKKDTKGLIKLGNERVVEARFTDAEFFWKKDVSQNLVKRISKLKSMNYYQGLGTYFDKVQRMKKIGGMISDELLISKEKVELSASISKVDLVSDLVREFPETQGIIGGYLADAQGFDNEISTAISEQYLPIGFDSKIPKKPISIALALSDKLDTLVGFFGIGQIPTSSKDPYSLRRIALGAVRIIVENKRDFKIRDLINYIEKLYLNQGFDFKNKNLQKELIEFLVDRLKFYMKENKIRHDIILSCVNSLNVDQFVIMFQKAKSLNKIINKKEGHDIISSYKRASNILETELKNNNLELSETTDPGIFKSDFEKNLFKKIKELKKYFSNVDKYEDFDQSLLNLAFSKKIIFEFFDNVIVNEKDQNLRKNRLELIHMLCKTFNKYINFSILE